MADSAFRGGGFLVQGAVEQLPVGYPALVVVLLKLGIASSFSLVLLNLLCVSCAFLLLGLMLRTRASEDMKNSSLWIVVCLSLASWVFIKHVTIPLAEFSYLALSMLALWVFSTSIEKAHYRTRLIFLATSLFIAFLSIYVRSIGVSLFVALLYTSITGDFLWGGSGRAASARRYACILVFVVLVFVGGYLFIASDAAVLNASSYRRGSYIESLLNAFKENGIFSTLTQNVHYRFREIGEIVLNVPQGKTPLPVMLYTIIGGVAWFLIGRGVLLLRIRHSAITNYLICYSGIMFLWPYYDSRFWIPVLPFLILCVFLAVRMYFEKFDESFVVIGSFFRMYVAYFILVGFIACFYSTSVTFSREFWKEWANGSYFKSNSIAISEDPLYTYDQPERYKAHLLRTFRNY